jgi:hypothetical protein
MAFVVEASEMGDDTRVNCWVIMRWSEQGEDQELHVGLDEQRSTQNQCVVLFEPDSGYQVEFFAVQEGEFSGQNPEVTYTVGQRMDQGSVFCGLGNDREIAGLRLCLQ